MTSASREALLDESAAVLRMVIAQLREIDVAPRRDPVDIIELAMRVPHRDAA